MSSNVSLSHDRSLLLRVVSGIQSLELFWPFPLLAVGVLGIQNQLIIVTFVVLAAVPWIARIVAFRRLTQRTFIGGALALLIAGAGAGMVVTYDPALSRPALLTLMGSVGLFFAIVNSGAAPRRVGSILVIIASLAAVYYIGRSSFIPDQVVTGWLSQLERIMSSPLPDLDFLMPQANALASFLEGSLLLSLALTLQARGGRRLAWGLATATLVGGLLMSRSRGSWIGVAVAMGIWALMLVPTRRLRWILLGLVGAGSVLSVYALLQFSPTGQPVITRLLETAGSRSILYRNSYHLLGDYLFTGIGPGETFAMVYSQYQLLIRVPFLTYPHNLPLAVGLGYGLLGLVALAWLLLGFYQFVVRSLRRGLSARSSPFFFATWLGLTASFVHGLTDSPQFSSARWTMPMLFAQLGLAIAAGSPAFEQPEAEQSSSPATRSHHRWKLGLAATAAIVLTIAVFVFFKPILSAWYANLGTVHHTWADLTPDLDTTVREEYAARAAQYYERALSLNPSQAVANRRLGMMTMANRDFGAAVSYLEQAFAVEPENQATLKALGLAYTWTGRMTSAEGLLRQLDDQSELIEELNVWCWWWGTEQEDTLSAYACEMAHRLAEPR